MCLLTIAGPGVVQDVGELAVACANNPDGFGYAVHAGDRIITEHSMVASEIIDRYLATRAKFPGGTAMFHARFATHGDEDLNNCPPFTVGGDERIVLAHNGMLPVVVAKDDHRSDTRIYATEVLPRIGITALDDPSWRAATEAWLGANKVAIVSASPRLAEPFYLLNGQLGTWVDGIWWSNDSYRIGAELAEWAYRLPLDNAGRCEVCDYPLDEMAITEELCQHCGACLWCGDPIDDCLCYPTGLLSQRDPYARWWEEQDEYPDTACEPSACEPSDGEPSDGERDGEVVDA